MELKIYWTDFAKTELKKIFDYYKKEASLAVEDCAWDYQRDDKVKTEANKCNRAKRRTFRKLF